MAARSNSWALLSAISALLLACGGGGGGGGTNGGGGGGLPGTLQLNPSGASLASATTVHLVASTTNVPAATPITWTVVESGMGKVVATSDTRSADYTAPATPGTYHVTASVASLGLSSTTEIKVAGVDDSSFFRLQLSPYKMNMRVSQSGRAGSKGRGRKEYLPGGPSAARALVDLVFDVPVVWSIAEGAVGGTVDATGLYTAPSQPGVYHLVATSIENPRVQASIEVRVFADLPPGLAAPGGSVAVRPVEAYLEPLDALYLKAVATGLPSSLVTWSLLEGSGAGTLSAPTGGADNEVQFTSGGASGNFHAVATATSDTSVSAQATVQVNHRAGIAIVPGISKVAPGTSVALQALVSDTSLLDVVWGSPDPTGGSLTATGLSATYSAPPTPGIYYVSVRPRADLERLTLARIEVAGSATPAVKILPPPGKVQPGTQLQLVAQVTGTSNTAVTWSTSAGSITADGLLTAPGTSGTTVTVTAKSVADATRQDTATIPVGNLPVFTSVPPVNANPAATYAYTPTTSHPDGLGVTVSLVSGPAGAAFGGGSLTWTPTSDQFALENQFVLKATDSGGSVSFQRWTVNFRVSGRSLRRYHGLDGSVLEVPDDQSSVSLAAYVPTPGGGFDIYPGSGRADGTFWVPGVPPGFYWIRGDVDYFWGSGSRLEGRDEMLGRATGFQQPTQPTVVTFNVSNMSPYLTPGPSGPHSGAGDELEWYDPNNPSGSGFDPLDLYIAPSIPNGATTLTGSVNLFNMVQKPNLASTALGDQPTIFRYAAVAAPGGEWMSVVREVFRPTNVAMANGSPTTLSGAFTQALPQVSANLSVDVAPLAALRTAVSPAATTFAYTILVDAEVPVTGSESDYLFAAQTPPLLSYEWSNAIPSTGTMTTGPVTIVNFFPSIFQLNGLANATFRVSYLLPGTTTPLRLRGGVLMAVPGTTGTFQIAHRPAPFRLNGLDAQVDRNGVGLNPVLRVESDPYTSANSELRQLLIRRLAVNGIKTIIDKTFTLHSFPVNEDFRIPPGILEAGAAYVMEVRMNSRGLGGATSLSGIIRP